MSVESIAVVLNHSQLGGTAKMVMVGIANHDGDGGAWPSIDTLARYANVNRRNVQRAIAECVEAGELEVDRQAGGTHSTRADRRPNRYTILVSCPSECDGTTQHRMGNGVARTTPRGADGVARATQRGGVSDTNGVAHAPPEPSLEPSITPRGSIADPLPEGVLPEDLMKKAEIDPQVAVKHLEDMKAMLHGERGPDPSVMLPGERVEIPVPPERADLE